MLKKFLRIFWKYRILQLQYNSSRNTNIRKKSGFHKNTNQEEAKSFHYHRPTLLKQKLVKNVCVHGKVTDISEHSEAVAQPIILFGQSMTSPVTDSILGPTVPSFSLQQLKIDRHPPVILASLFRGPMAFSTSFWLRYCFEASSEPDLVPLTYNSSRTEVRKSSHEDSDAIVAGL